MGKKRKKGSQSVTPSAPPASPSQPALTEEQASQLVAAAAAPEPLPAEVQEAAHVQEPAESVQEAAPPPAPAPEPVQEAAPEPAPAPAPVVVAEAAPVSVAAPSTVAPKKKKIVKKKKRTTKPPVSREALDQKIDQLEAKLEVKKEEAAKAAREGFGSNPALDDQSVPPVDLEIHDEFFAAGERSHAAPKAESGSFAALDPRHAQKMTAHAVARRAHLAKYVKWAVGAAAGIFVLGLTIKTLRGRPNEEPVRHDVAHVAQAAEQPAPQQVEQKVAPPVEQQPAPVAEEKKDEAKPADEAKTDEAKPDATEQAQPQADMPPEKPKNAWQEKQAAKAALERGSNAAAIAAGERSVALDASDAEAWLVLGAAYQAMGNVAMAKRSFHSCVSQGKKGPVSDCRDMLNSL